jgi:acetamidase/formamidase
MQRVTRDKISYVFDRRLEPVLRVAAGEVFEIETEDARTGQTRTQETCRPEYVLALRNKGPYYGNPVTGPIHVAGAEPGDTLAIHIREMECDTQGFTGYWPFVYHLQDWFQQPVTELVDICEGEVRYTLQSASGPHELRIPTRPMIGTELSSRYPIMASISDALIRRIPEKISETAPARTPMAFASPPLVLPGFFRPRSISLISSIVPSFPNYRRNSNSDYRNQA